jgi:hypothetical protein
VQLIEMFVHVGVGPKRFRTEIAGVQIHAIVNGNMFVVHNFFGKRSIAHVTIVDHCGRFVGQPDVSKFRLERWVHFAANGARAILDGVVAMIDAQVPDHVFVEDPLVAVVALHLLSF